MSVSSVSCLASVELTRDFCEQLDSLVGPQLTLLASDICEQFTINRRISGSVDSLISNISKLLPTIELGQQLTPIFIMKFFPPH